MTFICHVTYKGAHCPSTRKFIGYSFSQKMIDTKSVANNYLTIWKKKPPYSWYRVSDSNALYPVPSSQRIIPSNTLLYIRHADERSVGRWVSFCSSLIRKLLHNRAKCPRGNHKIRNTLVPCILSFKTFSLDTKNHYYPFCFPLILVSSTVVVC